MAMAAPQAAGPAGGLRTGAAEGAPTQPTAAAAAPAGGGAMKWEAAPAAAAGAGVLAAASERAASQPAGHGWPGAGGTGSAPAAGDVEGETSVPVTGHVPMAVDVVDGNVDVVMLTQPQDGGGGRYSSGGGPLRAAALPHPHLRHHGGGNLPPPSQPQHIHPVHGAWQGMCQPWDVAMWSAGHTAAATGAAAGPQLLQHPTPVAAPAPVGSGGHALPTQGQGSSILPPAAATTREAPASSHAAAEEERRQQQQQQQPLQSVDGMPLLAHCTPHTQVVRFVWSVLRHIVPPALLGSKHNRRLVCQPTAGAPGSLMMHAKEFIQL